MFLQIFKDKSTDLWVLKALCKFVCASLLILVFTGCGDKNSAFFNELDENPQKALANMKVYKGNPKSLISDAFFMDIDRARAWKKKYKTDFERSKNPLGSTLTDFILENTQIIVSTGKVVNITAKGDYEIDTLGTDGKPNFTQRHTYGMAFKPDLSHLNKVYHFVTFCNYYMDKGLILDGVELGGCMETRLINPTVYKELKHTSDIKQRE